MDLFVIVFCLLSERFLVHQFAHQRFHWFMRYVNTLLATLPMLSPWVLLAFVIIPLLLLVGIVLYVVGPLFFGITGVVLNIGIFYYCLGPVNPFYPIHAKPVDQLLDDDIGNYLVQANDELFAILFWYLILGPIGILGYRLTSLNKGLTVVSRQACLLLNLFNWFPARMTALLYLLVGNFQPGYRYFAKGFFSFSSNTLLRACGLAALDNHEKKTILQAEDMVEHAAIVFLVLLAFCTIVAWV